MPPITTDDVNGLILTYINSNNVMVFSKTTCSFCKKVKDLFSSLNISFTAIELDKLDNGKEIQDRLYEMTNQRTVPNVFIGGSHVGGADNTFQAHAENKLMSMISPPAAEYNFDLVVIGGGSGGLAASKEAASFGKKVAVCDFVKPSPVGTTWGLGGTCVNVGCIPKKLMHQAAILGDSLKDARRYGWEFSEEVEHKWDMLCTGVQDHIGSLNWGYRVALRDKNVTYHNSYAEFLDAHTIKVVNRRGKESTITSDKFILATGMRPRYPDIPGAKEFSITSDDLFSLPYCPGKTLCVGASYVSLECAGFLAGLGLNVTVMVRSILLRGFDQEIAERIGNHMEKHSVRFIRKTVPTRIERIKEGTPPTLRVFYIEDGNEKYIDVNTVLMAIGRDACTKGIGLEKVGVMLNNKNGQVLANNDQTNISNIYAIGDILEGKPELTPVAIEAGVRLARRMFAGSNVQCDYVNVPTTVFTPLEYGCCGLAEEDAIQVYGEDNIEVYHTNYMPLEYTVAGRDASDCYAKLICNMADKERVVGLHILGPNAGEVTQGYAVAMKCGATKEQFDSTIGIHPTVSELFTTLTVTKRSGEDITAKGC